MIERRLTRGFAMICTLLLLAAAAVAFADDDQAQMDAYWRLVGNTSLNDPLTKVMNGDHEALTLQELTAITADELLAFAAGNKLPVGMARYAWYNALAQVLRRDGCPEAGDETMQTIALFLRMAENPRDKAENEQRRTIRRTMTMDDITAYAKESGLPAGFLAWLMLDDEWHEPDWEDGDDWREGRRDWAFADWVEASDLREAYGPEAVVTEDDVERVLRQNDYRWDD